MNFTGARGLRPALYKGLHATAARLVQKVVAGKASGNRALWVKLAKMFNVPGVAHRNAIFGLKADSAGPSDSFHPIRAFPLRRQLICTLGGLNVPKDKVAFLKTLGMKPATVITMQGLLVVCSMCSSLEMVLVE